MLTAENERKQLQAQLEAAKKETDAFSIPDVDASARVENYASASRQLKEQREALLVTYTTEWPAVKKLDAQIKGLEAELQKAPAEIVTSMQRRYEAAVSKEQLVAALLRRAESDHYSANARHDRFDGHHAPTRDQQAVAQHIAATKARARRVEWKQRQRSKYRYPEQIAEESRLVHRGCETSSSRSTLTGGGIGLAFLLDFLDDTVKSVEDVDRYIHLPALALIPAGGDAAPRLPGALRGGPPPRLRRTRPRWR